MSKKIVVKEEFIKDGAFKVTKYSDGSAQIDRVKKPKENNS